MPIDRYTTLKKARAGESRDPRDRSRFAVCRRSGCARTAADDRQDLAASDAARSFAIENRCRRSCASATQR